MPVRTRPLRRGFPFAQPGVPKLLRALAAQGSLTATTASTIRSFIQRAESDGWWSHVIAFYGFVGGTPAAHGLNWKDPEAYAITNTAWTSGMTHDANGIQSNGTTGYGDTGLTPAAIGLTGGLGAYLLEPAPIGNAVHLGCNEATQRFMLYQRESSNGTLAMWGGINFTGEAATEPVLPTPVGTCYGQRRRDNSLTIYAHGEAGEEENQVTTVVPSTDAIYLAARNTGGTPDLYSTARYGALWITDGQLTATEVTAMTLAIQQLQVRLSRTIVLHNGMWNQWIQPRAIRSQGTRDLILTASIASNRQNTATAYDRRTGKLETFDLGDSPNTDDHNAPCVLMGRNPKTDPPTWFWTGHPDVDGRIYRRTASAAESVAAFAPTTSEQLASGTTYAQVFRYRERIVLFTRRQPDTPGGPRPWAILWSDDDGATWDQRDVFVPDGDTSSLQGLYTGVRQSRFGRILHVAFHDHPITGDNQDIMTLNVDIQNGGIYQPVTGDIVGNLYDGPTVSPYQQGHPIYFAEPGETTRLYDISGDGRMIGLASFTTTTDARYKILVLDDFGIVREHDLGAAGIPLEEPAGNNFYFPGLCFAETPGLLYVAREENGTHRIERWQTFDDGGRWQSTVLSEADDARKRFRPIPVARGGEGEPLLWCEGVYVKFRKEPGEDPEDYWDTKLYLRLG